LSEPPEETSPTVPEEGTRVGNLAPDFELQDLDGETVSLSELRGKTVLISFWETQCPACIYQMPYIQQVYDEWSGKGVIVLAVNIGESSSRAKGFLQSSGYSFLVLLDTNGRVAVKYGIRGIPTTFLIDKDGIIQDIKIGPFQSKEEIEAGIRMVIP